MVEFVTPATFGEYKKVAEPMGFSFRTLLRSLLRIAVTSSLANLTNRL